MALPLSPQQRVEQYISDWYSQWSTAKQEFGRNVDFERWDELVSIVERKHFAKGASSGTKDSFGTPDHDPSVEAVTRSNEEGNSAEVETTGSGEGLIAKYRVYSLKRDENAGWLISEILHLLDPPAEAVLSANESAALLALASHDAGLAALGPETLPNEPLLFTPNRSVTLSTGESDVTSVEELGKLSTSGVLGVFDIVYGLKRREPLERSISAGEYTVEVVRAFNRVAAVRLILNSDSHAVSWRPAKTASGHGNFGVDSGTAAIFDVESISGLSNIDFERPLTRWSKSIEPEILSMGADNNIVMFGSGFGDGAYPCYWGIDSSGEIVSLVVDLLVLSEEVDGVWKTI